ncbi:YqjF family protein [Oceanobacillus salinisoli]|uniref:YqjF family protein n=1 Tax=Oceanobacillus salinisoli TaxID=2678611 RepID=UPI0012E21ECC|nr:DUF2071 domain-containing protein [Oceanobacillus salinisoli]
MNLLNVTEHRPFPLPSKRWIMRQSWKNIAFFHWPTSPNLLRSWVPSSLEIDTFHGHAWVSLVVFDMENIHLRGIPSHSLTPAFSEVNLRTYVIYNGIPGVYFLSIDVDNWASSKIAKRWFRLPYHDASISIEPSQHSYHFECIRNGQTNIKGEGSITPLRDIYAADRGSLDYWLMERYRMYCTDKRSNLFKTDIHHQPWELQKAESEIHRNTLLEKWNIGVKENYPAVSHFSKKLDTLFWNIKSV